MPPKKRSFADEVFEIEGIRGHQPKKKQASGYLQYVIKWVGYPESDNSLEDSWQFEAFREVLRYWIWLSKKNKTQYTQEIAIWHRLLHEWQSEQVLLRSDDWHSISHSAAWIAKYDWKWQIQEFKTTDEFPDSAHLFAHYKQQVNTIAHHYENAPFIEVDNSEDNSLPIPWKQLIFGIEEKLQQLPAKDTIDDFGLVLSLNALLEEGIAHRRRVRLQGRMKQPQVKQSPKKDRAPRDGGLKEPKPTIEWAFPPSKTILKLKRSKELIWELRHMHEVVKEGKIIMPLTGELVDVSVANECMRTEGEFVAMSGFIRITEDLCLDRRYRCGFDRYIHHSCDPNCFVDVVWWKGEPVAMIKAKKDISSDEVLTLDYFVGFKIPKSAKPSQFVAKRTDHIYCVCDTSKCRVHMWMENVKGDVAKKPKTQRLLQHQEPFYGLAVTEILPGQQTNINGNKPPVVC